LNSPILNSYLTGAGFAAFHVGLGLRLARRLARRLGPLRAAQSLGRYLLRESSLFSAMPRRLVRHRGHVWAVPDLPPLDTEAFLDCLEREVSCAAGHSRPRPVTAIISLTGRCPHHCAYCYVDAALREAPEPSVDLLADTVTELAGLGVFTFHLSGGEPALRSDDVLTLLGRIRRTGLRFWMLSTGTGLDFDRLSALARAGLSGVMISLDSPDLAHVNRLKGSEHAFDAAVAAMRDARRAGLLVAVNAVMSRPLLGEAAFFRFIETVGGHGASFVNCYAPRRQTEPLPEELMPFSLDEYRRLDRLTRRCNASGAGLPLAFTPDLWEAVRGCQGGAGFLYIDPAGQVRRCPFLSRSYGNIRDGSLALILDRMLADPHREVCEGNRLLTEALTSRKR